MNTQKLSEMDFALDEGRFFAKSTRWPPSDPKSTIDTTEVFAMRDDVVGNYQVGGRVWVEDYFFSVIFDVPLDAQSAEYDVGPQGITARYNVLHDNGEHELYRAISGTIQLVVDPAYTQFSAKEFRFVGRWGSTETAEIYLGNFSILKLAKKSVSNR
ncbi:hypothetical protein [Pseudomonas sp. RA_35y_Pfl2_P32]|uniref:hypothetical protein n=1 Tax=Pseudomonas sp. RA_35y_Pfl2_P32 TaxID=3088705 RepID=UPI0030D75EBA